MENINFQSINAEYKPSQKSSWEGRKSNPDIGNQYWHQQINLLNINNANNLVSSEGNIALIGYVCDEGVRRNRGRIGAHLGPESIRERLAKLPIHFESKNIIDIGDVVCIDDDMEACQEMFSFAISHLLKNKIFPIALGGGHDMALGHFKGIWNHIKDRSKRKIGIINFDAHFDLRPVDKKGNSGTPFNQILNDEEIKNNVDYFVIGVQQQSNTKELFEIAKTRNIQYAINYDCESAKIEFDALKARLSSFIAKNDYLYVTIDLDGFSSAYAPGVSAPSPLGFTPYFVFKLLQFLINTKKVITLDIAELNPSLDRDKLTANLAAKIVDFTVMNL
jgi:formiminoglutamase